MGGYKISCDGARRLANRDREQQWAQHYKAMQDGKVEAGCFHFSIRRSEALENELDLEDFENLRCRLVVTQQGPIYLWVYPKTKLKMAASLTNPLSVLETEDLWWPHSHAAQTPWQMWTGSTTWRLCLTLKPVWLIKMSLK